MQKGREKTPAGRIRQRRAGNRRNELEKTMQRTWTKVGEEIYTHTLEDGEERADRGRIERAIEAIQWREIPKVGTLEAPFMPGEGIKAAVKQLRIPKVSHVAWTNRLAPYGFYGIRGHYKNGQAEIFIVDTGCELVPVCSDFVSEGVQS